MVNARETWQSVADREASDTRLAILLSLEASEADREKGKRIAALLGPRLNRLGLRRLDTPALGNCQFDAVCQTLNLVTTPTELRRQAVAYMRLLPDIFTGFYDGFPSFDAYLKHMSKDGSWGDALT